MIKRNAMRIMLAYCAIEISVSWIVGVLIMCKNPWFEAILNVWGQSTVLFRLLFISIFQGIPASFLASYFVATRRMKKVKTKEDRIADILFFLHIAFIVFCLIAKK